MDPRLEVVPGDDAGPAQYPPRPDGVRGDGLKIVAAIHEDEVDSALEAQGGGVQGPAVLVQQGQATAVRLVKVPQVEGPQPGLGQAEMVIVLPVIAPELSV